MVEDRSSLRLGDPYLGAWRGGGLVTGILAASGDALRTLLEFILPEGNTPMTVLYPLLRAGLETAALALYLLAPDQRDERLRRTYCVADDDARLRCVHEKERGIEDTEDKRKARRDEILQMIAERSSLGAPADFKFIRIEYSDLVRKADEALAADPAQEDDDSDLSLLAIWQLLSGLRHGKQWSMIEVLERSQVIVNEDEASAKVLFTTSPAVIAVFLHRIIPVMESAYRAYGKRTKNWSAQPEDAAEAKMVSYVQQRREHQERRATTRSSLDP